MVIGRLMDLPEKFLNQPITSQGSSGQSPLFMYPIFHGSGLPLFYISIFLAFGKHLVYMRVSSGIVHQMLAKCSPIGYCQTER